MEAEEKVEAEEAKKKKLVTQLSALNIKQKVKLCRSVQVCVQNCSKVFITMVAIRSFDIELV